MDSPDLPRPVGTAVGVARPAQNLARHYYQELYAGKPDLRELTIIVDAGFGAAYAIAPYVLRKLGANVVELNCENDGSRINVECGATDLRQLQAAVLNSNSSGNGRAVGVAFDGDADRALFVDETGKIASGDHVLFAIGCAMHARHELAGDTIVATVMSNIGFERALRNHGIALIRTAVGDRFVLERMREDGYTLGGEQSGHLIDFRYNTTGDGPRTAITLLSILASTQTRLSELISEIQVAPQVLVNVRSNGDGVLASRSVRDAIASAQADLGISGRLLIRASGTEPLIRVMAEGEDRAQIERLAGLVASQIEQEIARSASP
jgi:phosphoglucosamine mutase